MNENDVKDLGLILSSCNAVLNGNSPEDIDSYIDNKNLVAKSLFLIDKILGINSENPETDTRYVKVLEALNGINWCNLVRYSGKSVISIRFISSPTPLVIAVSATKTIKNKIVFDGNTTSSSRERIQNVK